MTILINADGCPGVSDVMKNKTSCRTLPLIRLNLCLWRRWRAFSRGLMQQPAGLIACGLRPPPCSHPHHLCRKKGTSLSRCLYWRRWWAFSRRLNNSPQG